MRNNRFFIFAILAFVVLGAFRSSLFRIILSPLLLLVIFAVAFAIGGWHAIASIAICVGSLVGLVVILGLVFRRRRRRY